jgi:DNA (cytosine-5)-methyltransferase 1
LPPETVAYRYPEDRTFRAAIPNLRFAMGVRFELRNNLDASRRRWTISFVESAQTRVGSDARRIETVVPGADHWNMVRGFMQNSDALDSVDAVIKDVVSRVSWPTIEALQEVWSHRRRGVGPYEVVDWIGDAAAILTNIVTVGTDSDALACAVSELTGDVDGSDDPMQLFHLDQQVRDRDPAMLAGFILASWFNAVLPLSVVHSDQAVA